MSREERVLKTLLRMMAAAETLAVGAVFLPRSWMETCHEWLGLGTFPSEPIATYLARHLSALYVLHAGFIWLASTDVRHFASLVVYLAISGIVFSIFITALDILFGFPWFWVLAEGPGLTLLSIVFLVLLRRIHRSLDASR
ncbi:MAG: hypothetical protein N2255_06290 [Kiritimatiellae bacterium]|nr:hypothetical protein [Kiritimatiellia bacterium]